MTTSKIEYLIGRSAKLNNFVNPFNLKVLNFLNDLSIHLNNDFNKKNFPDIIALSFFCSKKNILSLKNKYHDDISIRFGIGLLFHITPANIPTNFAYSLIFGLLSGNSNIVKVPSKKIKEIRVICDCFNLLLKKNKHKTVREMISVVRYSNNDLFTKKISLISSGRLIWGGDKTIQELKKFQTNPKNIDVPFPDRYSVSIFNTESFLKLSKFKTNNLIKNFYNDTYLVDQNACSSPHIILWKGKFFNKANKKFWLSLNELVKQKYTPPLISTVDNYSRFISDILTKKDLQSTHSYNKSLYVITLKKLDNKNLIEKSKWGFFYEYNLKNFSEIKLITKRSLQTLTYFGFSKKLMNSIFKKNNFEGIDRVIPVGQALSMNLTWDGYDIIKILSREIELR